MKTLFLKRLVAGIIDCFFITLFELALIFITLYIFLVLDILDINNAYIGMLTYGIFYPLYFILPYFYFAILESSNKKSTFGKRIFSLIVIDLYGNKISFSVATIRYFINIVCNAPLFIGFLISNFTINEQTLCDKLTGSIVISGNYKVDKVKNDYRIDA